MAGTGRQRHPAQPCRTPSAGLLIAGKWKAHFVATVLVEQRLATVVAIHHRTQYAKRVGFWGVQRRAELHLGGDHQEACLGIAGQIILACRGQWLLAAVVHFKHLIGRIHARPRMPGQGHQAAGSQAGDMAAALEQPMTASQRLGTALRQPEALIVTAKMLAIHAVLAAECWRGGGGLGIVGDAAGGHRRCAV